MAYGSPFSKTNKSLIPDTGGEIQYIVDKLYYFPNKLKFLHHNTTSFSKHQATSEAYDGTSSLQDEILEKIIGCTGIRYSTVNFSPVGLFSEESCYLVAEEIKEFAKYLKRWAEEYSYLDISQLADSLEGIGAKLKYLLTLS